ncbi:MAG: DNA repair protein RecO [Microgenomates bacterium OLB23]|nr:MAG: DNA repair protein RecO [Microgenomates bacterium OLB23]
MKSLKHVSERGIVLKKHKLPNQNVSLTVFTEFSGKIYLFAYGVRTITSKRLSHLETGNYLSISYKNEDGRLYLSETELIYGYSKVKDNPTRLEKMYTALLFLQKILPENEPEVDVFNVTLEYFKELNNKDVRVNQEEDFIGTCLIRLGYIDESTQTQQNFDVYEFVRQLINLKLR